MKEKINKLIEEMNLFKRYGTNIPSDLNDLSNIVKNKEDVKLINSWISKDKNINIKYRKLYRVTENGDKTSDFHILCDNKAPTLVVGKTFGDYIFGGFTKAK